MGKKIRVVCKERIFDSVRDAAKHFGICSSYITKTAKKYNISYGEAAEMLSDRQKHKWRDHKGNYFRTFKEMCDFHHVNYGTAQDRLYHDLDLEIVLSNDSLRKVEFNGKVYRNMGDILKQHNKSYYQWHSFRKAHKTLSKEKQIEKFFTEK